MNSTPFIAILGESGVGKTRLAATAPYPLFLDTEGGALSARKDFDPERIIVIPSDKSAVSTLTRHITAIKSTPVDDEGYIQYNGVQVGCLVVDTVDTFQQILKYQNVMGSKPFMDQPAWGKLLDVLTPIVFDLKAIPIPVIMVSHTSTIDPEAGSNQKGIKTWAIQGSLRAHMPAWFDVVLHVVWGKDGERWVVTNRVFRDGYEVYAKDRHTIFEEKWYKIESDTGYPTADVLEKIWRRYGLDWQQSEQSSDS